MITLTHGESYTGRILSLALSLTDSPALANTQLSGSIIWGDGGLPTTLQSNFPLVQSFDHTYTADGFYLVQVTVSNQRAPRPETAKFTLPIEITTVQTIANNSPGFIYGPILPRDKGFPTHNEWCFHVGKDAQVLESNIRLIILTSFGERLMDPSFGTGVRRTIFEPDTRLVETVLKEEISMAIARYEPRVNVESLKVTRLNDRDVILNAVFTPKDDVGSQVQLVVNLTP